MENEEIYFVEEFGNHQSPSAAESVSMASSPSYVYSSEGSEESMDKFGVITEVREGLDNFSAKGKKAPFKVVSNTFLSFMLYMLFVD
jgi:hypothetical protein